MSLPNVIATFLSNAQTLTSWWRSRKTQLYQKRVGFIFGMHIFKWNSVVNFSVLYHREALRFGLSTGQNGQFEMHFSRFYD